MKVGLLWRAEWDPSTDGNACKLQGVFAAFAELGVQAEPVVYSDETVESVRDQLLALDGVLVWVNPIEQGRDRSLLDPLLREAAESGVWVSAHPDVILKMGTKQVLADTAHLSWGTETHVYRTAGELRAQLPDRLSSRGPLVLKQHRGMGGAGVWKVELDGEDLRIQHASGDGATERVTVDDFARRCEAYFEGEGRLVEQPFQPRISDGMIRAYLTHDRVVGFTHQYPRGLMPPGPDGRPRSKVFEAPIAPAYAGLRARLETEWVPGLQAALGLETHDLPVIWDADFLFGPEGSHVLCEINVSSTFAFPELAMPGVAAAAVDRIRNR